MNPQVKQVRPLENFQLKLTFENGEQRVFDARPYLEKGVFVRLQDRAAFRAARVVAGSVEWPGDLDLSYDTLYLASRPIAAAPAAAQGLDIANRE
ncbi:MAG: DUF2442 domain-containing protein [Candidatus Tectomicrobia bacterium]|nr:DUF2442 domain-containing protein [Candidatus Tectomicrobia bacterium]